ncbi:MAG: PHP domain-containing protein [Planctomycetota bacterium]|jgi:predicted metal-dependent phosphoesterase TrpH
MDNRADLEAELNNSNREIRLASLEKLIALAKSEGFYEKSTGSDVNNHIHTTFSFSPYSPVKAVWMSLINGLSSAGIMDHDNIAGAEEFIRAGEIAGLPTTVGLEVRADCSNTKLNGMRINHPDQKSKIYMGIHGVPHQNISALQEYFKKSVEERMKRNSRMVDNLNDILKETPVTLSLEDDIIPISEYKNGGTVTERHILFALAEKIITHSGKGCGVIDFVQQEMGISLSEKIKVLLADSENIHYNYDLLGAFKSELVPKFYVNAEEECFDVREIVEFVKAKGAIPAYAYLGDVSESVTGDKKAQTFEDSFLDLLFEELKDIGFDAVTYMPSRNTSEQLQRVRNKCEEHGMLQISGEDINSPRQKFVCEAMRKDEFSNLVDSTWALIGHEKTASEDAAKGFFSKSTVTEIPALQDRVLKYKDIGLS